MFNFDMNILLMNLFLICLFLLFIAAYRIQVQKRDLLSFKQKYNFLYENSETFICEVNVMGRIVSFNKQFKELLSVSQGELSNVHFDELLPKRDRVQFNNVINLIKQGASEPLKLDLNLKGSSTVPVVINLIPTILDREVTGVYICGRELEEEDTQNLVSYTEEEPEDTVNLQPGMLFNYVKEEKAYNISYCKGQLATKMNIHKNITSKVDILDLFPSTLVEEILPYLDLAWQGKHFSTEFTYEQFTCYMSLCPISKSGEVTNVIASCIDITEKQGSRCELKYNENIYEKMLATMNEGVIIYDTQGEIVKANERAADILGLGYSDLLKRKPLEVRMLAKDKPEDSYREISCPSTITYYEGTPVYNKVFSIKKSDTESLWVLFNSLPIYKKDKKYPEYVILTITDITEQKMQEVKLIEANSQLNTLIENLNHGIMMGNKNNEIIYTNKFVQELFYFDNESEFIFKKATEIIEEKRNFIKNYKELLDDILEIVVSTREDTKEIVFQLMNGKKIELQYIPIINAGQYIGCIWKFADVTKRIEQERNLVKSKEEAERANNAKAKFLSNMSHELRTPLNAIIGFAQLMEYEVGEELSEGQHDNVQEILTAGRHLLKLINDILVFSQIKAESITMRFAPIKITEVTEEAINMLLPIANKKNITIYHEVPKNNDLYIKADATRIKQVLLNLISNGIKYNKKNGELKISYTLQANNKIIIKLNDTGVGISPNELQNIFKPFYRINQKSYSQEGTGIGLSLAKEFVERMGGLIEVESEVEKGSCFMLTFDLLEKVINNSKCNESPMQLNPYSEITNSLNLLYIEDNLSNIQLVRKILQNETRVNFHCALTGEEGLKLAKELKPDILLLDIHLPDQSGFEVLKNLKANNGDTKFIAVTADVMLNNEDLYHVGFHEVINKPLNVKKLLKIINSSHEDNFLYSE